MFHKVSVKVFLKFTNIFYLIFKKAGKSIYLRNRAYRLYNFAAIITLFYNYLIINAAHFPVSLDFIKAYSPVSLNIGSGDNKTRIEGRPMSTICQWPYSTRADQHQISCP